MVNLSTVPFGNPSYPSYWQAVNTAPCEGVSNFDIFFFWINGVVSTACRSVGGWGHGRVGWVGRITFMYNCVTLGMLRCARFMYTCVTQQLDST